MALTTATAPFERLETQDWDTIEAWLDELGTTLGFPFYVVLSDDDQPTKASKTFEAWLELVGHDQDAVSEWDSFAVRLENEAQAKTTLRALLD